MVATGVRHTDAIVRDDSARIHLVVVGKQRSYALEGTAIIVGPPVPRERALGETGQRWMIEQIAQAVPCIEIHTAVTASAEGFPTCPALSTWAAAESGAQGRPRRRRAARAWPPSAPGADPDSLTR